MEFRNHPIIENLRVNEDGTVILYQEEKLTARINDKTRKTPTLKVCFAGHEHSVAKLVMESWNGLRKNILQFASKIELQKGNHYSNLEWKEGINCGIERYKQKITPEDKENILRRVEAGEKIRPLAREFGISDSTIRKYIEKNAKK